MEYRKPLEKRTVEIALSAPANLGDRSWGRAELFGRNRRGSGSGSRRPHPERVDELEHVVGEFAGTVGGRQALDHFSPTFTVLEMEELLVADPCAHVERAKRLLARGRVQDDEHARYPLTEVEQRPLEQLGPKVDGDARLPVVALRIEYLPLVGVDGPAGAERSDPSPSR